MCGAVVVIFRAAAMKWGRPVTRNIVGFYWTLPVNWAGFRKLPSNVDDAAAVSRTIRYQRERVRRYVTEEHSALVEEIAFMDMQPDRATEIVQEELRPIATKYAGLATLVYVAFDEVHRWRHNPYLANLHQTFGLDVLPLSPEPVLIDGVEFDPIRHFAKWRETDRNTKTRMQYEGRLGMREALSAVPTGEGRWQAIADRLNADGIKTIRGGNWTAENVRKMANRLGP